MKKKTEKEEDLIYAFHNAVDDLILAEMSGDVEDGFSYKTILSAPATMMVRLFEPEEWESIADEIVEMAVFIDRLDSLSEGLN